MWRELKGDAQPRIAEIERKQTTIDERLDRFDEDEAFLSERAIDIDTRDRHRDKLREQLSIAQMDRHASELEEMDLDGILAFAERVLPSAPNLWVQSSLAQKQQLQQLLSGMDALRRKDDCWNRDNPPGFQLLGFCFGPEENWWT